MTHADEALHSVRVVLADGAQRTIGFALRLRILRLLVVRDPVRRGYGISVEVQPAADFGDTTVCFVGDCVRR